MTTKLSEKRIVRGFVGEFSDQGVNQVHFHRPDSITELRSRMTQLEELLEPLELTEWNGEEYLDFRKVEHHDAILKMCTLVETPPKVLAHCLMWGYAKSHPWHGGISDNKPHDGFMTARQAKACIKAYNEFWQEKDAWRSEGTCYDHRYAVAPTAVHFLTNPSLTAGEFKELARRNHR